MKNVLVLIHDDPGQESRLQAALDLTRALNGHLICLQTMVPPDYPPDVAIAVGGGTLMLEEIEREAENRDRTQRRLSVEDVSWNWIEATGDLAGAMQDFFGLADIIVISRRLDSPMLGDMARVAGDVVIGSRKPVVAVPESARGFPASDAALVAWDGSMQAAAALGACVPLLQMASSVTIVQLGKNVPEVPAEEAATYLSRHGIHALIVREPIDGDDVSDLILREANRANAGFVVMGGFGHSRILEALIGGTSHDLLRSSPIPLVLVH